MFATQRFGLVSVVLVATCMVLVFLGPERDLARAAVLTWDANAGTAPLAQDGSGNWDTATANWNNGGVNVTWNNVTPDSAVIGSGGTAGTITLTTPITVAGITFNGVSGNYAVTGNTITFSGAPTITVNDDLSSIGSDLAGSVPLIKAGAGTLRLDGSGLSHTGTTTVNEGVLELNSSGFVALGGDLVVGDGFGVDTVRWLRMAQLTVTHNVEVNSSGVLDLNGSGPLMAALTVKDSGAVQGFVGDVVTLFGAGNALVLHNGGSLNDADVEIDFSGGAGNLAVTGAAGTAAQIAAKLNLGSGARTFNVADITGSSAVDLKISGAVFGSGASGIIKTDVGTMQVDAPATYTGNTRVSAGALLLGGNNVLPSTTNLTVDSAGTFNLNGFSNNVASLTVENGGAVQGNAGNVLSLSTTGNALTLNNGANLTDSNVTLKLTGGSGGQVVVAGTAGSFSQIASNLDLGAATRSFNVASGVSLTINGAMSGAGAVGIIKTGAGTMQIDTPATYPGATTVNDGTLRLGANNVLPNTTLTVNGPGIFDRVTYNATIGALNLNGASVTGSGGGTLTLGGNVTTTGSSAIGSGNLQLGGASRLFDVTGLLQVSDVIQGGGGVSLTKTGSGTLTLYSASTYAGTTFVEGGALDLFGPGSIANSAEVRVGRAGSTAIDYLVLQNPGASDLGMGDVIVGDTGLGQISHEQGNVTIGGTPRNNLRIGVGATGTYYMDTGAAAQLHAAKIIVGESAVAYLSVGPGSLVDTGDLTIAQNIGSSGTLTQTGGTINVTNLLTMIVGDAGTGLHDQRAGSLNVSGTLILGNLATGDGTVTLNDSFSTPSSLSVGLNTVVGGAGTGHFSMGNPGGGIVTHSVGQDLSVKGTYDQTGGTTLVARDVLVGRSPTVTGTVNLSGGVFASQGNEVVGVTGGLGNFNQTGGFHGLDGLSSSGRGNLTVNASGQYTLAGNATLDFHDYDVGTPNDWNVNLQGNPSTLTIASGNDFIFTGGTILDVTTITVVDNTFFTQQGGVFVIGRNEPGDPAANVAALTTINGNFMQTAGRLDFDVFDVDLTPGVCCDPTANDQLKVNGHVTLNGTVHVDFIAPFVPAFGSYFTLIHGDAFTKGPNFKVTGAFHRVVSDGGSGFVLQVYVPEPASLGAWTVIALAGLAVAIGTRRRRWKRVRGACDTKRGGAAVP